MAPPIIFLGTGRSFTTIVSAMVGQHPQLYGFPELNLTMGDTVGEWLDYMPRTGTIFRAGVLRSMAQLVTGEQTAGAVAEATAWLNAHREMSTAELFQLLQAEIAPKRAVEKSPFNVSQDSAIARLPQVAPDAVFIHITRHPYSASNSIMNTPWYRDSLKGPVWGSYDHRSGQPVFDPQVHWYDTNARIVRFLDTVPPERWIHVRGEDVLENPEGTLPGICKWLGISDAPEAIDEMKHPERSPYASYGPANAPGGNDPSYLEDPALRTFRRPKAPLTGPLPWRGDGAHLSEDVVALAQRFGYVDERKPPKPLPAGFDGSLGELVSIAPDGDGVPMAHCNLLDSSFSPLPPLTRIKDIQHFATPANGGANLGSYTGREIAISVYDKPDEPALVARRLADGETLWQTPLSSFPAVESLGGARGVSGLLLAELQFETGAPVPCVFAGNEREIQCLDPDGSVIWQRDASDIVGADAAIHHGSPRCLRPTPDGALFYATFTGWVVKLDPLTGTTIDVMSLDTGLRHRNFPHTGRFGVFQSLVMDGDYAFLEGMYRPEGETLADEDLPTCLIRLRIAGLDDGRMQRIPETLPDPLPPSFAQIGHVGTRAQGGSPVACHDAEGALVLVANGFGPGVRANTQPLGSYDVAGFRNAPEGPSEIWRHRILAAGEDESDPRRDPRITAAPAIDPQTRTLLVTTRTALMVFLDIPAKSGDVVPDAVFDPLDLLTSEIRTEASSAEFSSPITLARKGDADMFYAYVGLAVFVPWHHRPFAFTTCVRLDPADPGHIMPVWTASNVVDAAGNAVPAARSFAQPALFTTEGSDGRQRPGLIMSTMMDGVAIYR